MRLNQILTQLLFPLLWSRFFQENIGGRISNSNGSHTMYGVYTDYESDHSGAYTLIIGKESDEAMNTEELASKSVPAGEYLKFEKAGKLPDATIQAWQEIWAYFEGNTEYERLYTADFEEYKSDEGVCIYIAVKKA